MSTRLAVTGSTGALGGLVARQLADLAPGMAFTLLRDNFYLDVLSLFADEDGVIRGPAGSGAVLRDPGAHAGATYTLCGPEALTLKEVTARVGPATGRCASRTSPWRRPTPGGVSSTALRSGSSTRG